MADTFPVNNAILGFLEHFPDGAEPTIGRSRRRRATPEDFAKMDRSKTTLELEDEHDVDISLSDSANYALDEQRRRREAEERRQKEIERARERASQTAALTPSNPLTLAPARRGPGEIAMGRTAGNALPSFFDPPPARSPASADKNGGGRPGFDALTNLTAPAETAPRPTANPNDAAREGIVHLESAFRGAPDVFVGPGSGSRHTDATDATPTADFKENLLRIFEHISDRPRGELIDDGRKFFDRLTHPQTDNGRESGQTLKGRPQSISQSNAPVTEGAHNKPTKNSGVDLRSSKADGSGNAPRSHIQIIKETLTKDLIAHEVDLTSVAISDGLRMFDFLVREKGLSADGAAASVVQLAPTLTQISNTPSESPPILFAGGRGGGRPTRRSGSPTSREEQLFHNHVAENLIREIRQLEPRFQYQIATTRGGPRFTARDVERLQRILRDKILNRALEQNGNIMPPNESANSVIHEARSVPSHVRERNYKQANAQLYRWLKQDRKPEEGFERMFPGFVASISPGPRGAFPAKAPLGFTWHHHPLRPGTMELVLSEHHRPGSPARKILHPQGKGGFASWAKPIPRKKGDSK